MRIERIEDDRSCGNAQQGESAPVGNVQKRDKYEHIAFLGTDHKNGDILIAARTNDCMQGVCNWTDHWVDNAACGKKWITKIMVVTFTWRQNIGHIGTTIVICGVHGHRDTMAQRCSHPKYKNWRDKLATTLEKIHSAHERA